MWISQDSSLILSGPRTRGGSERIGTEGAMIEAGIEEEGVVGIGTMGEAGGMTGTEAGIEGNQGLTPGIEEGTLPTTLRTYKLPRLANETSYCYRN